MSKWSEKNRKFEVRITLIGRTGHLTVTGNEAKGVWELFQKHGHEL